MLLEKSRNPAARRPSNMLHPIPATPCTQLTLSTSPTMLLPSAAALASAGQHCHAAAHSPSPPCADVQCSSMPGMAAPGISTHPAAVCPARRCLASRPHFCSRPPRVSTAAAPPPECHAAKPWPAVGQRQRMMLLIAAARQPSFFLWACTAGGLCRPPAQPALNCSCGWQACHALACHKF